MTPFAAEISNSISRYITHKAKEEELADSSKLIDALFNYMQNLYPLSFKKTKEQYMCFAMKHTKCSTQKCPDNVEEWIEYVPVHMVFDYKQLDKSNILLFDNGQIKLAKRDLTTKGTLYRLCKGEVKSDFVYLEKVDNSKDRQIKAESLYFGKMHNLQDQLQTYTNIKNGFVVFITNHDVYWKNNRELDSYLKVNHINKMTLLPKLPKSDSHKMIYPHQIVWIDTRIESTKCCIGTFDEFFNCETYNCTLPLKRQTKSYDSEFGLNYQQEPSLHRADEPVSEKLNNMLKGGRMLPSSKKTFGDWESDFLNDYSRLMMSPAVRRMKDKTQVFTMDESDFVRSRLTHSLEVANIVKLIGLGIEDALEKKSTGVGTGEISNKVFPEIKKYHIPQILEVAALIHDIGNPPYGHFGEQTIQNYFANPAEHMSKRVLEAYNSLNDQQKADFAHFDGNVQGFRILCHLGLSNDCTSFNLNKVILSSMIKYPFNSLEGNQDKDKCKDHRKSKFGYFYAEERMFQNIQEYLCLEAGQRHPLAYLLEAADDITYIGDDIEDGWKLGYISALMIAKHIDALKGQRINEIFDQKWPELRSRLLSTNGIIAETAIQSIRIRLQRFMISRIISVFCEHIDDIVNNKLPENKQELFDLDSTLKAIHDDYWNPLVQRCYDGIHMSQLQGERVITSLLNIYLEAVIDPKLIKRKDVDDTKQEIVLNNKIKSGMLFETISDNYRDDLAPIGQFIPQDNYGKFMLVTDYISGMTDTFAYNRYRALCVD